MDLLREHRGPPETHPNQWNPDAGQHWSETDVGIGLKWIYSHSRLEHWGLEILKQKPGTVEYAGNIPSRIYDGDG